MNIFRSTALTLLLTASLTISPNTFHIFGQNEHQQPLGTKIIESGTYRLFIWKLPVGEEKYAIERKGESIIMRSHFEYSYTQKKVSLTAMLQTRADLQPGRYEIKGANFRGDQVNTLVDIRERSATVREGAATTQLAVPDNFFTVSSPFPVAVEMMLVRYWISHGAKKHLSTLPSNQLVTIDYNGRDTINVGEDRIQFDCFSVGGLTWGRTWLWFDSAKRLIAAIAPNTDASGQLQAVRQDFESALPDFLTKAAEHGMSQLRKNARVVKSTKDVVAIVGGTLVDGTGKPPINDAVVVIQAGRIISVGLRSQVIIPKGATIIDARGQTILPGLWDMHAHMRQVEWGPVYLAAGVTTIRDVGNDLEFVTAMREAITSGRGLGPRMLLAGFIDATDPTSVAGYQADTEEQACTLVNMYKWAGFDQIKVWNNIKPNVLKVIIDEAHRLGLTVTGHVPKAVNAFQAVDAGQDQINHAAFMLYSLPNGNITSAETKTALQFFRTHGTVIDPTLAVVELLTHSVSTPIATFEPGIAKVHPDVSATLSKLGVAPEQSAGARSFFELELSMVGALHRLGVPIVAGTDQVVPGHSLHRELELYVKAGFTPMEAIQAATIVPARVMKMDKEVGTIERGKRADLVITNGNPLDNISNIRNVKYVVTSGEIYDAEQLWQLGGFY